MQVPPKSIPHVSLVERHLVTLQQFAELVLKRRLGVMLLLAGDVFSHVIHLRVAEGENAVAVLPREVCLLRRTGLDPHRGAPLQLLHHVRRRAGAGQHAEHMHMILDSAHNDGGTMQFAQNAAEVTMHFLAQRTVVQEGAAILGGKHDMEQNFRKRLGHVGRGWTGRSFDSTLSGLRKFLRREPRVAPRRRNPGLDDFNPFRIEGPIISARENNKPRETRRLSRLELTGSNLRPKENNQPDG